MHQIIDEYSPSTVSDCLELIVDIGCDYDGYHTAENLKSLIDEIVHYAWQARILLRQGESFSRKACDFCKHNGTGMCDNCARCCRAEDLFEVKEWLSSH